MKLLYLGPLLLPALLAGGCAHTPATATGRVAPIAQVWGERGPGPGQFIEPRAISIAPNGYAFIVDSSGRIQKWTTQGKFIKSWMAPSIEKGRPEGVVVLRDGHVAITDTHYSQVRIYQPDGKLLRSFGTYGTQTGGFLLVTGICTDAEGYIYTADYGGAFDRVSKWTEEGRLVASWSGHGEGPRQFRRPCGLAISREGDLLVADVDNHRLQRLDRHTGAYKGSIGRQGRGPGEFDYPNGLAVDRQGFIYTVEFGGHRVQKLSPDGQPLAMWGGPGRAVGQLANPWGLAVDRDENVYVADTQNYRVQKFHF